MKTFKYEQYDLKNNFMYLYSEGFNVVSPISSSGEIRKIELNLVPTIIQPHGHCANEGFDSCGALVIACSETSTNVLIIKNLCD